MMPGMSIHVVDVSRGVVAAGMAVEVFAIAGGDRRLVACGTISAKGTFDHPALDAALTAGEYEAVLQVGSYYREARVELPAVPFLDVVTYRFGIADSRQHYHLPFKCTPWGYSCFHGGA
jgi:5-hydroxyisourate hydrolase